MQDYQEDINAVEGYLVDTLDAVVIFAEDEPNAYWRNGHPTISICTKQSKRLQLYTILHEAGHAIIRSRENYEIKFPYGRQHRNKSISRRVDVLREEVVAWECGHELAADLGIKMDQKLWHNFVKKNLFDYVRWACDPSIYKGEIGKP
jgi:endonuclease I